MAVSSAYIAKWTPTALGMSLMYRLKSLGPNKDPCGTPLITGRGVERLFSTLTLNSREFRNNNIPGYAVLIKAIQKNKFVRFAQATNAHPHTARIAQDFLRQIQTLLWPARSPNLSPVEHVWDHLKRQMPSCHSVHDLELAVQDLWAHLSQDNIRYLINSTPDRVAACIAAGGGPTRY
ncbi:transposable element Tcb2 transposase [Trichonephila clavipes]|nr:transposable element Tcb2 transposase [Trichonephila clavipes]